MACQADTLCTLAAVEPGPSTPVPSLDMLAHEAAAAIAPAHAHVRGPRCADQMQKRLRALAAASFALPHARLCLFQLVCSPALASRQAAGSA